MGSVQSRGGGAQPCVYIRLLHFYFLFRMPAHKMTMPDLARLINSDEIQSVVRPAQPKSRRATIKKNPLKNANVAYRLNPHAKAAKRSAIQKAKAKK